MIIFSSDNSFRIGFDAGESPAGYVSIFVKFVDFKVQDELIYEVY